MWGGGAARGCDIVGVGSRKPRRRKHCWLRVSTERDCYRGALLFVVAVGDVFAVAAAMQSESPEASSRPAEALSLSERYRYCRPSLLLSR